MSSWLQTSILVKKQRPLTLTISHNSGFFSCCTVRLEKIIQYFNKYKTLPYIVDSSAQFDWYRPCTVESYFMTQSNTIKYTSQILFESWHQFIEYKQINYKSIEPFIQKYFSPTNEIIKIIEKMESKYSIDYTNLCVLFYRGNDKAREIKLHSYDTYIKEAKQLKKLYPELMFLIQSDETEFIEILSKEFADSSFYFKNEIRHIKKSDTTVDKVFKEENHIFSKYFLAITLIMAKCKYIICEPGNCSLWISLYRGSSNGIIQHLELGK